MLANFAPTHFTREVFRAFWQRYSDDVRMQWNSRLISKLTVYYTLALAFLGLSPALFAQCNQRLRSRRHSIFHRGRFKREKHPEQECQKCRKFEKPLAVAWVFTDSYRIVARSGLSCVRWTQTSERPTTPPGVVT
jgi:hypothetical protein